MEQIIIVIIITALCWCWGENLIFFLQGKCIKFYNFKSYDTRISHSFRHALDCKMTNCIIELSSGPNWNWLTLINNKKWSSPSQVCYEL